MLFMGFFEITHLLQQKIRKINYENIKDHLCTKRIEIIIKAINTILYIYGWILVYNMKETECKKSELHLYNIILAHQIFITIVLAFPFIIVFCVCLCLPCLICFTNMLPDFENNGLTEEQLDQLSTFKFGDSGISCILNKEEGINENTLEIDEDDKICCICMEHYKVNDILRVLKCKHHMHKECCDEWLKRRNTCPICRAAPACFCLLCKSSRSNQVGGVIVM